jgi:hypothetical protein
MNSVLASPTGKESASVKDGPEDGRQEVVQQAGKGILDDHKARQNGW